MNYPEQDRLDSRLLHFEDDDPRTPDLPFVNLSDALAWFHKMHFNLGEWQDRVDEKRWESTGFIEEKLDVYDGLEFVGQLIRLRETCPKCSRPDTVVLREDANYCTKCGVSWDAKNL